MKRLLLLTFLLIGMGKWASAQQDPMFTHYMFNQVIYNPGFIGVENDEMFCANFVQRNQWLGYTPTGDDGSIAPITTTFNLHRPFKLGQSKNKLGAGLILNSDQLGFMSDIWVYGGLSYIYEMGTKKNPKTLSVGLNAGIVQKAIDPNFKSPFMNDPAIQALGSRTSDVIFDLGIGAVYKTKDYFVGISTLHLPQNTFEWYQKIQQDTFNSVGRHVYITGGYDYAINGSIVLQPRALMKFDRAKFQWDLGVLATFNEKYWGGLNVRDGEGIMFLGGFMWKDLKFGVSYDLTLSQMQSVSNGTVELMLNYCFPLRLTPKAPEAEQIPRFLGGYTD